MFRVDGIEGHVAVVTGAARGIGRQIAERLNENGACVAGFDVKAPSETWMYGVRCDVSEVAEVDSAFTRVEIELGAPTILVLNAGIYHSLTFEATTSEIWRQTLSVNLDGAFYCVQRAIAGMRDAAYGRIVAIGSSAGKTGGTRNAAAYAASKAGLMTLVKSIANEYAPFGITANAVAPTLIDTAMIAEIRDLAVRIPVRRLGTADEVSMLVTYLCSAHAAYITGEITDINGGYLID